MNCNGTHGLDLQHKCFSLRCVFPPNVNYTQSKLQFQEAGGKHNEKISLITLAKNVGVPKKDTSENERVASLLRVKQIRMRR